MECFKCSVSSTKTRLFDVISSEGVVKICEKCLEEEDLPVIRRPTTFQLKEAERKPTVYERLSKAAGIKPEERRIPKKEEELIKKQEITLREIIDRNYKAKYHEKPKPRSDLVDNFHWIIMMARREKKITAKQLAEAISESEAAIKMAEQGILPEDEYKIVNKLEAYLRIKILKKNTGERVDEMVIRERPKNINFDTETSRILTIADLKMLKKEKEYRTFKKPKETYDEEPEFIEIEEDEENKEDNSDKELSDNDIEDIIFGKKP